MIKSNICQIRRHRARGRCKILFPYTNANHIAHREYTSFQFASFAISIWHKCHNCWSQSQDKNKYVSLNLNINCPGARQKSMIKYPVRTTTTSPIPDTHQCISHPWQPVAFMNVKLHHFNHHNMLAQSQTNSKSTPASCQKQLARTHRGPATNVFAHLHQPHFITTTYHCNSYLPPLAIPAASNATPQRNLCSYPPCLVWTSRARWE